MELLSEMGCHLTGGHPAFGDRELGVCGAGLTSLVAYLTSGALQVLTVGPTALVAVTVWAYFDHRTRSRAAQRG